MPLLAALSLALAVNARNETFVVESCAPNRQAYIGTGVVVARENGMLTLATAAHIVEQSGDLRILDTSRHAFYQVVDVRVLLDYDLAFVQVRAQQTFPVDPVLFAPAVAGEKVIVWGNPASGFWSAASGTVQETSAHVPGEFGSARIAIDCRGCTFGDSGSGVFDEQGRLIGILTRAWSDAGGTVRFIEVEPAALIAQEAQIRPDEAADDVP